MVVDLAALRDGSQEAHSLTLRRMCLAQRRVEQLVLEGKNVFFTGNAGTGKGLHAAMPAYVGAGGQAVILMCWTLRR